MKKSISLWKRFKTYLFRRETYKNWNDGLWLLQLIIDALVAFVLLIVLFKLLPGCFR